MRLRKWTCPNAQTRKRPEDEQPVGYYGQQSPDFVLITRYALAVVSEDADEDHVMEVVTDSRRDKLGRVPVWPGDYPPDAALRGRASTRLKIECVIRM